LYVTYEIKRFVVKISGKQIENHSMSTCKLKYAYNKFERTQSGAGYKQYGLELFSTNGTTDVVFLNEFT